MLFIAIIGEPGSGKTSASAFLAEKGLPVFRFSAGIREELERRGIEDTLRAEEEMGNTLREEMGPSAMAQLLWPKARASGSEIACVEGPRNIEELEYLARHGTVVLIALKSDQGSRFSRLFGRGESRDPNSMEELKWREEENRKKGLHKLLETKEFERYEVKNDGTLRDLEKAVHKAYVKILEGQPRP